MKKFKLIIASVVAAGAMVFAGASVSAAGYGTAGCGLGSIIISGKGIVQIFAGTTNATLGNQTFGITSGTSNCTPGSAAFIQREQKIFVHANKDSLKEQMAAGAGEKLSNFASLLGCPAAVHADFGKLTRANYTKLADQKPSSFLTTVKSLVTSDKALSKTCRVI